MRRITLAGASALVVLLIGCTPGTTNSTTEVGTPAPSPSSAEPSVSSPSPSPSSFIDEAGETVVPNPPILDDAARASAIEAAETVMRAFARPDLDYETWWEELFPLLTQDAAERFVHTDPINVPAREVTGPGEMWDDAYPSVMSVKVPTDVGPYLIQVIRMDNDDPWLTSRIQPWETGE